MRATYHIYHIALLTHPCSRTGLAPPLKRGLNNTVKSKIYALAKMPRKIIPYNSQLKQLAKNLRNDSTLGEVLLWNELKGKKFSNFDFHRQKPLLNYIADLLQ